MQTDITKTFKQYKNFLFHINNTSKQHIKNIFQNQTLIDKRTHKLSKQTVEV